MHYYFPILLFLFAETSALCSGEKDSLLYTSHVFSDKLKSVQLYKEGWNLSYPVIKLNSDEKLLLSFDLLGDKIESYYYTFYHCTKDWEKSDIFPADYLDGFYENPIEDYKTSFNTTVAYVHYYLSFPNDRIRFTVSGNYVLWVYTSDHPENPVLTQRFIITEDAAGINVTAHRPRMTGDTDRNQQIDFTVNYAGLKINDPYRDIYAFILQNGRWDNAKKNLKPDFYGNNSLNYSSLSDKNVFPGGNEFRYFDIKSVRYNTEFVRKIDFVQSNYQVYLFPSENREFKPYFYWHDFDGKYYIAVQEQKNPDTDADYAYVYFTLPSRNMVEGGKIYVSGALANWTFDNNNVMIYSPEHQAYECTMFLKQGWYDYEYVFRKDGTNTSVASLFEGSHYETENDYTVIVYYRNPMERYDRVVGLQTANTLNHLTD